MSGAVGVIEALSLLTPCEVASVAKLRIGNPAGDGGYIAADRLRAGQKVYSYGVSTEISFDLDLARRGLEVFLYDHTIEALPETHPRCHFRRQGLSSRNQPDAALFRLDHHIAENRHDDTDMILKMDIEGAEWEILDDIAPSILARFEQIILEIHKLSEIRQSEFRNRLIRVFTKLNTQFNLYHVHANNVPTIKNVLGLPVAQTLEVTLLRKDLGDSSPWRSFIPSALDFPNSTKQPDHVLAFFPFLPVGLSMIDLKAGLLHASRHASEFPDQIRSHLPAAQKPTAVMPPPRLWARMRFGWRRIRRHLRPARPARPGSS